MDKSIHTLVEDINKVLKERGGWEKSVREFATGQFDNILKHRFENEEEKGDRPTLRMSNMGTSCKRKLWYTVNEPNEGHDFPSSTIFKFLYGDIIEVLLLSLAIASGHRVEGMQDELSICGIKGHRDAVIDGVTVDVKSASPRSFQKFKEGKLQEDDPFGYISQLSSYVYAGHKDNPDAVDEHLGAFLVVDKVSGEIYLDLYSFEWGEDNTKEKEFNETIDIVNDTILPERGFRSVADGYYNKSKKKFIANGNMKLDITCSYCEFKDKCWPSLRTFMYKTGNSFKPVYFTKVVKEPKVLEIKD